jgi:hypothetical protein
MSVGGATVRTVTQEEALARARGDRWLPGRRLRTLAQAGRFVESVDFALLYPTDRIRAPSLFEAVAGPDVEPWAHGMGPAESAVWTWKDALPDAGLAWSGRYLYRRGSVLSPPLLAALYPGAGEPDDHRSFELSPDAHRLAEALLTGPLPSRALRELIGHRGHYDRAVGELQRHLLVSSAGVQEQRTGWPAVVLDLTCRLFDVGGRFDPDEAAGRFLTTMVAALPAELGRAFGWSTAAARHALDRLVDSGRAAGSREGYRACG